MKRGHPSGSSTAMVTPPVLPIAPSARRGAGAAIPSEPGMAGRRNGVLSAADSSRATPLWPSRSGRFGVTSTTSRSSSTGMTSRKRVPGAAVVSSSRMPSCSWPSPSSRAEQSIPSEGSPRIFRFSILRSPGSTAPTGAKGYFFPAATLGAPHTTWRSSPLPSLTRQRLRRSALGWGSACSTSPITTSPRPPCSGSTASTGAPSMGRRRASSRASSGRRRNPSSQRREMFISAAPQPPSPPGRPRRTAPETACPPRRTA